MVARSRPTAPSLGRTLRDARQSRGWSQAELGGRLSLTNGNFVGMVERDERTPSDELLAEWADALGLPLRPLLSQKLSSAGRGAAAAALRLPEARFPRLRAWICGLFDGDRGVVDAVRLEADGVLEQHLRAAVLRHDVIPHLRSVPGAPPALRRLAAEGTLDAESWEAEGAALLLLTGTRALQLRFVPLHGSIEVLERDQWTPLSPVKSGADAAPSLAAALASYGLDERQREFVETTVRALSRPP